jgi:hypothetical protein
MSFTPARKFGLALALVALASLTAPTGAEAQQTVDPVSEVSVEGNVVTLSDGTQVTLDPEALAAIDAALAEADAPRGAERLRDALTRASQGTAEGLAAAAAYAASREPTLASAIAVVTIRRCGAPDRATLAVANLTNVPGVEPNRVAAAIEAADDLSPGCRQAGLDGLLVAQPVAGGPPPGLTTELGPAINTAGNESQDTTSNAQ